MSEPVYWFVDLLAPFQVGGHMCAANWLVALHVNQPSLRLQAGVGLVPPLSGHGGQPGALQPSLHNSSPARHPTGPPHPPPNPPRW